MGLLDDNKAMYYRVSAGKVRKTTDENDPNAIKRTIELKEGGTKDVYEIVKKGIEGRIDSLKIDDGNYGRTLVVGVDDGFDKFFLNVPWESSYCRTLLEKINAIDLSKDVTLIPYSFKGSDGKTKTGISVYQSKEKIMSYYKKYDAEGKKIEGYLHDYPHGSDGMSTDEFKIIGIQQMVFLKEKVVECFGLNAAQDVAKTEGANTNEKDVDRAAKSDDGLPF